MDAARLGARGVRAEHVSETLEIRPGPLRKLAVLAGSVAFVAVGVFLVLGATASGS